MTEIIVKFVLDEDEFYLTSADAEKYKKLFDEQSERFKEVFEPSEVLITPIIPSDTKKLDRIFAEIEEDGNAELKWLAKKNRESIKRRSVTKNDF